MWEVVEFFNRIVLENINVSVSNNIYYRYFNKLYKTNLQKITNVNLSYINSSILQMVEQKKIFCLKLSDGINSLVYICYAVFYLSRYSVFFSIAVSIVTLLSCSIIMLGGVLTDGKLRYFSDLQAKRTNLFMDGIKHISTLQKVGANSFFKNKIYGLNKLTVEACTKFNLLFQLFFCLYRFSSYLIFPICVLIALRLNFHNNPSQMIELLTYISMITILLVNKFGVLSNAFESMLKWKATQIQVDEIFDASFEESNILFDSEIQQLTIRDLTYEYESVSIKIPHFTFDKGDFVCITGESGQGKTTLLKILSGCLDVPKGIFVNGSPLTKKINLAYMAQDCDLLDLTLRENLTFGNANISDETIVKLLKDMGLMEWFISQQRGLETRCGDKGTFISTGQKQRLNIIKFLLLDKDIYLFDEPTSHIDIKNKERTLQSIKTYLEGKTAIFVTHDSDLEKFCNKKYYFKNYTIYPIFQ